MSAAAVVLAVVAIVVSLGSLYYVRVNVGYNRRGVSVAERAEHDALTPMLVFTVEKACNSHESQWAYCLRNDSRLDLCSVTVNPPEPRAGVRYPLALLGGDEGWVEDGPLELGPLPMGQEVMVQLAVGPPTPGVSRPHFQVRVTTTVDGHSWDIVYPLTTPPAPSTVHAARVRLDRGDGPRRGAR